MLKNKDTLIAKFLSGNCTEEEQKTVRDWIQLSSENESEFQKAKKTWEVSLNLKVDREADTDQAWDQFRTMAEQSIPEKRYAFKYFRAAAGIPLIAFLSALTYLFLSDTSEERPKVISMHTPAVAEKAMPQTVSTDTLGTPDTLVIPAGKPVKKFRKTERVKNVVMITLSTTDSAKVFLLPDNSVVFLNHNSTLTYPDNFNKNNRKVSLTGEAFFEVKKDTMQFIVACRNTITRGQAASFNIKGYDTDKEVEVIIVSGNAEFSGIGKTEYKKLILNTGERGTFGRDESIAKAKNSRKDFKWRQKKNLRAKIRRIIEKIKNRF